MRDLGKLAFSGALTGLLGVVTACGQPSGKSLSETKHDMDKPTRGTDSWMWRSISPDEYQTYIADSGILKSSDPLTQRAQFWVDKIDATIRSAHPDQLANTPKPHAVVIGTSDANAFMAPVPVCYDVNVHLGSGRRGIGYVHFDLATGVFSSDDSASDCIDAGSNPEVLKTLVSKFNAASADCQLELSGDDLLLSDKCEREGLDGIAGATHLTFEETSNYITILAGIVPMLTEDAFVAVLSHELGHYYRSHGTTFASDYNFFYTLDKAQVDHRPTPEADKQELGQEAVVGSLLLDAGDIYNRFPGQQIRSEFYFGVGTLIAAVSQDDDAPAACADAAELITDSGYAQATTTFPVGELGRSTKSAYAVFEKAALACLAKIDLVDGSRTLTGTTVSWDVVQAAFGAPIWPRWVSRASGDTASTLDSLNGLVASRIGSKAPEADIDLRALLLGLSEVFEKQDAKGLASLHTAYDQHLGEYTIEQEADEESLEWLSALGLDPNAGPNAMAFLAKGQESSMDGLQLGEEDCQALRQSHWTKSDGSYEFAPIGDFTDIHHSLCFRQFNMEREIQAHNHKPATNVTPPTLGGQAWKDLQARAKASGQTRSHHFSRSLVKLRKSALLQCPLAGKLF